MHCNKSNNPPLEIAALRRKRAHPRELCLILSEIWPSHHPKRSGLNKDDQTCERARRCATAEIDAAEIDAEEIDAAEIEADAN